MQANTRLNLSLTLALLLSCWVCTIYNITNAPMLMLHKEN